jgi:hypothetical protein
MILEASSFVTATFFYPNLILVSKARAQHLEWRPFGSSLRGVGKTLSLLSARFCRIFIAIKRKTAENRYVTDNFN